MVNYQENITLCGASAYTQKFYLNEDFGGLPETIRQELNILCVLFTEDVGGTIRFEFTEEGNLEIITDAEETDYLYDDIGAVLKVKQIRRERRELLESLEMYYRVFFLGEDPAEYETEED